MLGLKINNVSEKGFSSWGRCNIEYTFENHVNSFAPGKYL